MLHFLAHGDGVDMIDGEEDREKKRNEKIYPYIQTLFCRDKICSLNVSSVHAKFVLSL